MGRASEGDEGAARRLFWFSVIVTVSIAAYAISRPITWLVRVVPDDTFYYLKIASIIAREKLSSFDGINPTNGYHPGWMFLVVILAKVFDDKVTLLRATLATALMLHVATGYCLSRALRRWMSPAWSWIGGACWILNPLPVFLAIEGMEASLYVFALSTGLWFYGSELEHRLEARSIPHSTLALLGLAFGACILARTDQIVLCAVVSVALLWNLPPREKLRFIAVTGGVTILSVLPWFAYSRWATGAFFQHSGAMKFMWARKEHVGGIEGAWEYVTGEWLTYPLVDYKILDRLGHRWPLARIIPTVIITLGLLAALKRGLDRPDTRRLAWASIVLVAGTLLTGVIYGLFFTDRQDWYRGQPALILYVVLYGALVRGVLETPEARRVSPIAVGGASVAVFAATLVALVLTAKTYPWQQDVYESQPMFEQLVPHGQAIGCFNAGIPAYFSDRTVINLDGLTNNAVFPYYQRDEFDQYLRDAGIGYIADEDLSMKRAMLFVDKPMPMQVLATTSMTWMTAKRRLWHLAPR
jgi:hypothetical protein